MPSQEKSVFVKLGLRSADFKEGIDESKAEVKDFAKGSVVALAAVTAAFAATTAVVASLVLKQSELANRTVDLSDQLGTSASELQALSKAAFEFGIEQEGFVAGLLKLRVALGQAADGTGEQADSLRDLGLEYKDIANLDPTQQFRVLTDALHNMTDENERAAISQALFGRELGKTANAMARVKGTADRLLQGGKGLIGVDDNDLLLLANIPIELDKINTVFGSIFARIGSEASPAIQALMGEITEMGIRFREDFLDGSIDLFLEEKAPEMITSFISLTEASLDFTTEAIGGFNELFGLVDEGAGKTTILAEVMNSASDVIATGREQMALKFLEMAEAVANLILLPFTSLGVAVVDSLRFIVDMTIKASETLGINVDGLKKASLDLERASLDIANPIDFTETKKDLNTIIDLTKKDREEERKHREEMLKKKMSDIKAEAAAKVEAREKERQQRGEIAKEREAKRLFESFGKLGGDIAKGFKDSLGGFFGGGDEGFEEVVKTKEQVNQVKFAGLLQRGTAEEARISGGQQNQREIKMLKFTETIAKNSDPKKNRSKIVKF